MIKLANLANRTNLPPMAAQDSTEPTEHPNDNAPDSLGDDLRAQIIGALRTIYDPEIPVNIYDLGLIYQINLSPENHVAVKMTLTAPGCPVAGTLPGMVENTIKTVEAVQDAKIELVWEPAWTTERMSEDARLALGMF